MLFMMPNVLKNLFQKSATRMYPAVQREPFEMSRGELVINIEDCIFCKACERKCPSQCITIDKQKGLWTCDPMACVYCGICVDACPKDCLDQLGFYRSPNTEREFMSFQGTPRVKKVKKKEKAGEAA